jgi:hypothetical protein
MQHTKRLKILMSLDEVLYMEFDKRRGISLSFDRKNPMR